MEWHRFVTYLLNDPSIYFCPGFVIARPHDTQCRYATSVRLLCPRP